MVEIQEIDKDRCREIDRERRKCYLYCIHTLQTRVQVHLASSFRIDQQEDEDRFLDNQNGRRPMLCNEDLQRPDRQQKLHKYSYWMLYISFYIV